MPERIQMRRTKGWRKPEGTIYVGRPTRFGNPIRVGQFGPPRYPTTFTIDATEAVARYRLWLEVRPDIVDAARQRLAGHDLACWCRVDAPCHADVLLELANA